MENLQMYLVPVLVIYSAILISELNIKYKLRKYPHGKGKTLISNNATSLTDEEVIYHNLKGCKIPFLFARITYEGHGNSEEDRFIYYIEYYDSETQNNIAKEQKVMATT